MKTFKEFILESNNILTGRETPIQLIKKRSLKAYHVSKNPSLNINKLRSYVSDESIKHHMHVGTLDQSEERARFSWSEIGYTKPFFLYEITLDTTKMVPHVFEDDDPEFEALEYEKEGYTSLCYLNAHESEGDEISIVIMNKAAILNIKKIDVLRPDFED